MTTTKPRPKEYRTVSQAAVRAFVVLFILAWLLAGASWWLSVRTLQGQIRTRASFVQLCESGNEARAQQVQLWEHIITISAPPPAQTPAQRKAHEQLTAGFQRYLKQVFALRDCGHLSSG